MTPDILAVLGPTNTGKTHLALERMLGHKSGMIGFPLRLLARENYDRIARLKGAAQVALITGEEKILPPHPRWFVCTVESMPLDRPVDFLAIDEIQLCADPERGHVFTDRLLHARGLSETMFLGSDSIKGLIRRLVPGVQFLSRPRLSSLLHAGERKLTRLPRRTAIVAFSAAEVYALAELVRRQHGGAAVVLGALSPRTRNAQIALYQGGEVDYLIATDAIGMGLNMDVDHVAFASLAKFDGRAPRRLGAAEMAQIAGRAGRHMTDGSFGTTADAGLLEPALAAAIEGHVFPPLTRLQWRNPDLRFTGLGALLASLEQPPGHPALIRAREADDQLALKALAGDAEILGRATGPERLRLLWEVCRIPDFRKAFGEQHARLLGTIFLHLTQGTNRIPADWLDAQLKRLDRTDGEVDSLTQRIAHVRVWTYVSHRHGWLDEPAHWQERSRAIEDRLSDALHARLAQRFVDRRTTILSRGLKEGRALSAAVAEDGAVKVEGHFVGHLVGFAFRADRAPNARAARSLNAAAQKGLAGEIGRRAERLAADGDEAFALTPSGAILWRGEAVARLKAGPEPWRPTFLLDSPDRLDGDRRRLVERRLENWLRQAVARALAPLPAALESPLKGAARGLIHQLAEGLGSVERPAVEAQMAALSPEDRKALARLGIRLGVESLFFPDLLKPAAQAVRGLLWAVSRDRPVPAPPGRTALALKAGDDRQALVAMGYRILGGHAVRADMLEGFAAGLRALSRQGAFQPPAALMRPLGLGDDALSPILAALGYRRDTPDGPFRRGRKGRGRDRRKERAQEQSSPFAVLKQGRAR